jgi:hypothetical protein
MVNGVLVERTVGDVLPQLQSNSDNMNKVLVELAKQYKTKQDDMEKWKVSLTHSWQTKDRADDCDICRRRTRFRLCSNNSLDEVKPIAASRPVDAAARSNARLRFLLSSSRP